MTDRPMIPVDWVDAVRADLFYGCGIWLQTGGGYVLPLDVAERLHRHIDPPGPAATVMERIANRAILDWQGTQRPPRPPVWPGPVHGPSGP